MALLTTQPAIRTAASGDSSRKADQLLRTELPGDRLRADQLRDLRAIEVLAFEDLGSIDSTPAQDLARALFGEGEEREQVHDRWRGLIRNETFRHHPDRSPAEQAEQSYEWLRMVNDTIGEPRSLATDPSLLASLHEWTAIVDGGGGLCTVASIHYNLFLGSLLDHESAEQRDLSEFTSMRRIGTFLCTELDHGNDSAALETTAELDPESGGFILNTPHPGAQKFMPNTSTTGGPKSAVVAARLITNGQDHGVYLFLTPLSDEHGLLPGIRVRRLPLRPGAPVDHCLTAFDQVRLPREALLEAEHGRLGHDGTLISNLGNRRKRFLRSIGRVTVGKMCMSGAAVGASRAALAIAVRYGEQRRVAGPKAGQRIPVNAHRSHHARLLRSLATAYAMTFLHRSAVAAWTRHTAETRDEAERLVAVAKGWITWQARLITAECRERCGAQGLFAVNALTGFPEYVEGTVTAEGDNLVIWSKAAAELLFASGTTRSQSASAAGPRELTNPRFVRSLLAQAETLWQTRARTALRQGPAKDPVARWNWASSPALEMVSVHARLQAADAFLQAAERVTQPEARQLLDKLCLLFLLEQISSHTGDLLAEAHMSADQVRDLPSVVDTVIDELASDMKTLVDAFDLPEEYLDAIPIANSGRVPLTDYAGCTDIAE